MLVFFVRRQGEGDSSRALQRSTDTTHTATAGKPAAAAARHHRDTRQPGGADAHAHDPREGRQAAARRAGERAGTNDRAERTRHRARVHDLRLAAPQARVLHAEGGQDWPRRGLHYRAGNQSGQRGYCCRFFILHVCTVRVLHLIHSSSLVDIMCGEEDTAVCVCV